MDEPWYIPHEDCVETLEDGTWNDVSCHVDHPFFCQKPASCVSGMFGEFCDQPCNCDGKCDDVTGECHGKCFSGWMGHSCQINVVTFSIIFTSVLVILVAVIVISSLIVRQKVYSSKSEQARSPLPTHASLNTILEGQHSGPSSDETNLDQNEIQSYPPGEPCIRIHPHEIDDMPYEEVMPYMPDEGTSSDSPNPEGLIYAVTSGEQSGAGTRLPLPSSHMYGNSSGSMLANHPGLGYEVPCVWYVVPPPAVPQRPNAGTYTCLQTSNENPT